jgi:uncharacterized membrane protein/protein-disulfide isomerase
MERSAPVKPLPYWVYHAAVSALVLLGLGISVYLSLSHYWNYTDLDYQSFCAISESINCDTVSQSPYSILLSVPVPVWGVIGYAWMFLMLIPVWSPPNEKERGWALMFWMALVFTLISVALAAVSSLLIHSYCILCIATYVVNLFTLWFAWLIRRRFSVSGLLKDSRRDLLNLLRQRRCAIACGAAVLMTVAVVALIPPYWRMTPPPLSAAIPTGVTPEGFPWMGAEKPEVEIILFSDYQCFQCKKMNFYLRQLVSRRPDRLRLVHRHYPMDHEVNFVVKEPFHVGSGKLALLAIYAGLQGKFWEMNDILFEVAGRGPSIDIEWLAARTGFSAAGLKGALSHPVLAAKLGLDVWQGMKLRVLGTPSFVIDNKIYAGNLPADIIRKIAQ